MDLLIIMVVSLILVPVAEFTAGPLRIILGAVFLLFLPGYTLMAALFPQRYSLQGVERVALSFALSIAVVPLIGLILNYTPWGIRLEPIFVAIFALMAIASAVALLRRSGLTRSERFEPRIHIRMPSWGVTSRLDRGLSIVLVIAIMGAIAALVYAVTAPRAEERFTDFYILGSEGMLQDYPRALTLGEQTEVILGIINHEHQRSNYKIQIVFDGQITQEVEPIALDKEEEWKQTITLTPTKAADDQKVEFLLYKGNATEPYLTLHLWLDVKKK